MRRLARGVPLADTVVAITADRYGFAGVPAPRTAPEFGTHPITASRAYGSGPRHQRWLPGGYASPDGAGVFVSVFSGDIVGRLNGTATAAFGESGTVSGGSVRLVWRHPRPALEIGGHGFLHRPSAGRFAPTNIDSLDVDAFLGAAAMNGERRGDGWFVRGRGGIGAGSLQPRSGTGHFRGLGFAELDIRLTQSRGARGMAERLRIHAAQGHTRGHYSRTIGTIEFQTTGRDVLAMQLAATIGRMAGSPHPFEQFTVGGVASPVVDSSLVGQRFSMPMFPTGIAIGRHLWGWRIALPSSGWALFYEGASVSRDALSAGRWHRAAGAELRYATPPIPPAFVPRVELRGGGAYLLDDPFKKKIRVYLEMRIEP